MINTAIYQKLETDLHTAQKGKDAFTVKVLRFLKSNLDAEAKAKLKALSDDEVIKIIQRRIKQSQEAQGTYQQGGRMELAAAEQQEIDMIRQYLPRQLSEEELGQLVSGVISGLKPNGSKDFGRVMGQAVKEVAGRAEGARIKAAVEKALGF